MAKGSGNWIWWTIGGITLLGLGVGVYIFIKDRKSKKEQEKMGEIPMPSSTTSSSVASSSSSSSSLPSTPFKTKSEGDAFRQWVNSKDSAYARSISLDPSGRYDNTTIRKAWAKYGQAYNEDKKSSSSVTSSNSKSDLNTLKTAIQGGYVKDVEIDGDRVRGFALDGTGIGSNNIYVNLYPNGYIYYEDGRDSNKKAGSWSGTSPMTIKIEGQEKVGDPKYTITDLAKILYPDVKGGFAFSDENADFENFMHEDKVGFIDSNDSLL